MFLVSYREKKAYKGPDDDDNEVSRVVVIVAFFPFFYVTVKSESTLIDRSRYILNNKLN